MRASDAAGQTPNIWWKAVSMDELRSHPSYAALPASPPPLEPSTYRYAAILMPSEGCLQGVALRLLIAVAWCGLMQERTSLARQGVNRVWNM